MIKKDLIIGIFVGFLANLTGVVVTATFLGQGDDFTTVIKAAINEDFLGKLISLGAILNLIAFFIFIKKRQDYKARGVLIATVCITIFTFLVKLY